MSKFALYVILAGHCLFVGNRERREGEQVELSDADAERLTASGAVRLATEADTAGAVADLKTVLDGSVGEVVAKLDDLPEDPAARAEALAKLAELEGASKARKGVLEAIAAAQAALDPAE